MKDSPTTRGIGEGTRIATPLGLVPVQALRPGDAVLTQHGPPRRVLKSERISCAGTGISANALAEGQPLRDMAVAAGQIIHAQGGAAQARLLVNGASIVHAAEVHYYVLHLNGPGAVLAERLALDCDGAGDAAPRDLVTLRAATDARAGLAPGELLGVLGRAGVHGVQGWAHDRGNPGQPVLLEIRVDGELVAALLAEHDRPDLKNVTGSATRGLEFRFPTPLSTETPHLVSVRRATDGAELRGSPVLVPAIPAISALLAMLPDETAEQRAQAAQFLRHRIDGLLAKP
jgi:hypothetical protein